MWTLILMKFSVFKAGRINGVSQNSSHLLKLDSIFSRLVPLTGPPPCFLLVCSVLIALSIRNRCRVLECVLLDLVVMVMVMAMVMVMVTVMVIVMVAALVMTLCNAANGRSIPHRSGNGHDVREKQL
jgi:hypothetical protein